jgi:hypothetical protein
MLSEVYKVEVLKKWGTTEGNLHVFLTSAPAMVANDPESRYENQLSAELVLIGRQKFSGCNVDG